MLSSQSAEEKRDKISSKSETHLQASKPSPLTGKGRGIPPLPLGSGASNKVRELLTRQLVPRLAIHRDLIRDGAGLVRLRRLGVGAVTGAKALVAMATNCGGREEGRSVEEGPREGRKDTSELHGVVYKI